MQDLIDVDFYGHKVMIPRNYDSVLKVTYSDYMQMPPIEKRGVWHSGVFWDLDNPYSIYI